MYVCVCVCVCMYACMYDKKETYGAVEQGGRGKDVMYVCQELMYV